MKENRDGKQLDCDSTEPRVLPPTTLPKVQEIADRDLLELATLIHNIIERRMQEGVPHAA